MKAVMPEVPQYLLEARARTGADRWDEMWEAVLHMPPPPNREHQDLTVALVTWLQARWGAPQGNRVHIQINVASPGGWPDDYRIPDLVLLVVVRKVISHEKGQQWLFDEIRYFFYVTNDWASDAEDVVFEANTRCDQENLIAQLAGGVRALCAPVDNLLSNWAYMVMTALAWNLKAWWALWLPEEGRWREKHQAQKHRVLRMEFRTFLNAFIKIPCQIVRVGRKLIYRVLSYNPHLPVFFRLSTALRC